MKRDTDEDHSTCVTGSVHSCVSLCADDNVSYGCEICGEEGFSVLRDGDVPPWMELVTDSQDVDNLIGELYRLTS